VQYYTLYFCLLQIICSIAVGVQVGVDTELAASIPNSISTSADAIWLYFGGPGGMLYIASGIWFMRLIGAAAFFVSLICGQLAGGAIMDATGFLGARVIESSATRVVGMYLLIDKNRIFGFLRIPITSTCPTCRCVYCYGSFHSNAS
jgi:uncharacterized membrane protein YdcZ (DUF606 family)